MIFFIKCEWILIVNFLGYFLREFFILFFDFGIFLVRYLLIGFLLFCVEFFFLFLSSIYKNVVFLMYGFYWDKL